ncbi:MAG: FHA domain-containing protein [Verrucomicrobia bacterium]|nr:FHA domain-containing protein [Verrucomicrobiota bacterium]
MSATLVITKDHALVQKVPITSEVRIGRSPKCQVVLVEPLLTRAEVDLLSREQISIVEENGVYWVEDLKSRNGTYLAGERLTRRTQLQNGDEITIGGLTTVRIKFLSDTAALASGLVAREQATVAAPTVEGKAQESQARPPARKPRFATKLTVLDGPAQIVGTVFENWTGALNIGRARENEVMIPAAGEDGISAFHARIECSENRFWLVDCNSKNGTLLDGRRVDGRIALSDGQTIYIGKSRFAFAVTDIEERRKRLKIAAGALAALFLVILVFLAFRPPDRVAEQLRTAKVLRTSGKLDEARKLLEAAFGMDPTRSEVKEELDLTTRLMQRNKNLETASQTASHATTAEAFEEAKKLCIMVLNDFRNDRAALELKSAIESVEGAEVAIQSQNWDVAIRKMESQLVKLPESRLLRDRLARANAERTNAMLLAGAQEHFSRNKLAEARSALEQIPDSQSYYSEAKKRLQRELNQRQAVLRAIQTVKDLYQQGNADALRQAQDRVKDYLGMFPENEDLKGLQDRIRFMLEKASGLAQAELGATSTDIKALQAHQGLCLSILRQEQGDWITEWRRRTERTTNQLGMRLWQLANDHAMKGSNALAEALNLEKDGAGHFRKIKETVESWNSAIAAGHPDPKLVAQRDDLNSQLEAEAGKRFAKVYPLIQQRLSGKNPSIPATLKDILDITIEGNANGYYSKAKEALKALGQ